MPTISWMALTGSGYSLVVLGGLAYVNGWGVPFVDEKMIYTMMVAVLVFDGFNFRRKAKCLCRGCGGGEYCFRDFVFYWGG